MIKTLTRRTSQRDRTLLSRRLQRIRSIPQWTVRTGEIVVSVGGRDCDHAAAIALRVTKRRSAGVMVAVQRRNTSRDLEGWNLTARVLCRFGMMWKDNHRMWFEEYWRIHHADRSPKFNGVTAAVLSYFAERRTAVMPDVVASVVGTFRTTSKTPGNVVRCTVFNLVRQRKLRKIGDRYCRKATQ